MEFSIYIKFVFNSLFYNCLKTGIFSILDNGLEFQNNQNLLINFLKKKPFKYCAAFSFFVILQFKIT